MRYVSKNFDLDLTYITPRIIGSVACAYGLAWLDVPQPCRFRRLAFTQHTVTMCAMWLPC